MLKMMTENWFLKLLSLTFALILWFFVMGEQRLEQGFSASLQLRNIPKGLMIANEVPSTVDVRISGPRTLLINLKPTDVRLSVDLNGLSAGVTTFKRLEESLNLPSALKVTRLSPSVVNVKLEPVRKKTVPVRVGLTGAVAPGRRIESVRVVPEQVGIEGAASEIKEINEAVTDPIDIEGVTESIERSVQLNPVGQYVSFSDDKTVQVTVAITTSAERNIPTQQEKKSQ